MNKLTKRKRRQKSIKQKRLAEKLFWIRFNKDQLQRLIPENSKGLGALMALERLPKKTSWQRYQIKTLQARGTE